MSFLTPLYALGVLAVAAPLVFHLIRRSPKGEVPFSSLMFLSPTPPRLTRRSRLEHWLLLALRATALALLALAFAKPFVRQAVSLGFEEEDGRRIALLIDTSASMRRGDLWPRAQALASQVLRECRPTDQLGVFAFDTTFRPLLSFHESVTLDPARRQTIAKAHLGRLAPTWSGTNLGQALVEAVSAIEDVADKTKKTVRMPRRVVLISDLAQGSRLDALGGFEWPSDVELDLKTVADTGSNAGIERLTDQVDAESGGSGAFRRIRVVNNSSSAREKFALSWVDEKGTSVGSPIDVYVPPGESRVARVPRPPAAAVPLALRLTGDNQSFDNMVFFGQERQVQVTVAFIGADRRDDPGGLLYYLDRAFLENSRQTVRILCHKPTEALAWDDKAAPELVVMAAESHQNVGRLEAYIERGGTVLYIVTGAGRHETLAAVAGVSPWTVDEATIGGGDVMLGEIAFDHPLFAALSGAQFNNFTKIRFWKYRRIESDRLGEARVLARFETRDAAIIEKRIGKGRLVVLASGWQPADSQLARSSKFVPLMANLLGLRDRPPVIAANQRIGDRVALVVTDHTSKGTIIRKPDGHSVTLPPQTAFFEDTDQPGVYTIETASGASSFAVNLDPLESKTEPLHVETVERFGVRLANHSHKKVDRAQLRRMHNAELEGRQKLWRRLILTVIGILVVETWLAGRTSHQSRVPRAGAVST